MIEVSARDFLADVFPEDLVGDNDIVLAMPVNGTFQKFNLEHGLKSIEKGVQAGWLYCISTVRHAGNGMIRTRMTDLRDCFVLVLDDIGTKANTPPVEPSYKMETSAGNYQWGYFIDPVDVSYDSKKAGYIDGCLRGLAEAGFNDKGCTGDGRQVKLPGAIHAKSGFVTRIVDYHPQRVWNAQTLMKQFGVKPKRKRRGKTTLKISEVNTPWTDDILYNWLADKHWLLNSSHGSFVDIRCPWENLHTKYTGDASTGYSPLNHGFVGRQFKCLHGHCAHRGIDDFIEVLRKHYAMDLTDKELQLTDNQLQLINQQLVELARKIK